MLLREGKGEKEGARRGRGAGRAACERRDWAGAESNTSKQDVNERGASRGRKVNWSATKRS